MPWLIFFWKKQKEAEPSKVPAGPNNLTLPAMVGRGFHSMSYLGPRSPTADPGPQGHDDSRMRIE